MPSPDTGHSVSADERAVAPLIGFILLFGLLVTAFAGYQATAVPQQNADTEFQHFQDVQDDMIVVRNSISTAGQADTEQFESVQLGATYRERILALNPPAAAGSLRTSDAYDITVGGDNVSSTRFLTYRNGYNEFEVGPIRYENSVVYLDERDDDGDGNVVILEEQNLVEDGELRITALQNEYQESGIGRTSVELYPVDVENADDLSEYEGDVTVGIPTRLTADEYWGEALQEEGLVNGDDYKIDEKGEINRLVIYNIDIDNLQFNTIGIREEPDEKESVKRGFEGNKNTATLEAVEKSVQTQSNELVFTVENTGSEPVTVDKFSVDATSINSDIVINDGNNQEFQIRNEAGDTIYGYANAPGNGNSFVANGDNYELTNDNDRKAATIAANSNVKIDFRSFGPDNSWIDDSDEIELVGSVNDADIIITLGVNDGTDSSFYFRVVG
jgi:hypothetical protein